MVFQKAIERAEASDVVKERVEKLIESITYSVFMYTSRGLFERDKLIFTSQVAFQVYTSSVLPLNPPFFNSPSGPQVLLSAKQIDPSELDFLLRFPVIPNVVSPVDFLPNNCWGGIKALSGMEQFRNLDRDIEVDKSSLIAPFLVVFRVLVTKTF